MSPPEKNKPAQSNVAPATVPGRPPRPAGEGGGGGGPSQLSPRVPAGAASEADLAQAQDQGQGQARTQAPTQARDQAQTQAQTQTQTQTQAQAQAQTQTQAQTQAQVVEPSPSPPTLEDDLERLEAMNWLHASILRIRKGRHPDPEIEALLKRRLDFPKDRFLGPYPVRLLNTFSWVLTSCSIGWVALWALGSLAGFNEFVWAVSGLMTTLLAVLIGLALSQPIVFVDEKALEEECLSQLLKLKAMTEMSKDPAPSPAPSPALTPTPTSTSASSPTRGRGSDGRKPGAGAGADPTPARGRGESSGEMPSASLAEKASEKPR